MPLYGPQCIDGESDDASSVWETSASTPPSPLVIPKERSLLSFQPRLAAGTMDRVVYRKSCESRMKPASVPLKKSSRSARDPDIWPDGTTSRPLPGRRYVAAYVDIVIPKRRDTRVARPSLAQESGRSYKVRFAETTSRGVKRTHSQASHEPEVKLTSKRLHRESETLRTPRTRTIPEPPPLYHSNTDSPSESGTSSSMDSAVSQQLVPRIPLPLIVPFPLHLLRQDQKSVTSSLPLPCPPPPTTTTSELDALAFNSFLLMRNIPLLYTMPSVQSLPQTSPSGGHACTDQDRLEVTKRAILAALSVAQQPAVS